MKTPSTIFRRATFNLRGRGSFSALVLAIAATTLATDEASHNDGVAINNMDGKAVTTSLDNISDFNHSHSEAIAFRSADAPREETSSFLSQQTSPPPVDSSVRTDSKSQLALPAFTELKFKKSDVIKIAPTQIKLDWEMWQMYKFDKSQRFVTREDQFGLPIFRGELRSGKMHVIAQYFTWESPWTEQLQKRMVKVSYEFGNSKKWANMVFGDIEVLKIDGENWQGPNAWHVQGASNTIGIMKDAYGFNTGIPGGWAEFLWYRDGGWNPDGKPVGQGWFMVGTTKVNKETNVLFSFGSKNKGQLALQSQINLNGFRITPTYYLTGFGQGASLDFTKDWKIDKNNSWGVQYNHGTAGFGPGRSFNQGEATLFARLANGRGAWATLSLNQPTNGKPAYFTVNAGIRLVDVKF